MRNAFSHFLIVSSVPCPAKIITDPGGGGRHCEGNVYTQEYDCVATGS